MEAFSSAGVMKAMLGRDGRSENKQQDDRDPYPLNLFTDEIDGGQNKAEKEGPHITMHGDRKDIRVCGQRLAD